MMRAEDVSPTTVDALVRLFRRGLLSLIPIIEESRIPWREGEAYDQWDEIAAILYEKLVIEPLAWAVGPVDGFKMAPYDVQLDRYRDISLISVTGGVATGTVCAFVGFLSDQMPLDTAGALMLNRELEPMEALRVPVDKAVFELLHRADARTLVPVTDIWVPG